MTATLWIDPGWLAGAHSWIDARLADAGLRRTGEIEQPHVRSWSTVMRVPTDAGPVWFKANEPVLAHEAALVDVLSERDPDLVPPLLARDPDTGWMIMADGGVSLRTVTEEPAWLAGWADVLPRYARLQVATVEHVDRLLALGVPDLRLETVPAKYADLVARIDVEQRFRDATSRVADLCAAVASYDVPPAIQHDDLHDAQMFVRDGRHLLLDWADACVTHPFFSLSVALEGVLSWGLADEEDAVDVAPYREAYLAVWNEALGRDVSEVVPDALRLGWAVRAVNGHVDGELGATHARLRMFLDGEA